jgi:hypothetical protein
MELSPPPRPPHQPLFGYKPMMMNWLRGLRFRWRVWRMPQGDVRKYGFVKCSACGNFVRLNNGRCEVCGHET